MKKLVSVVLGVVMVAVLLAGCGGSKKEAPKEDEGKKEAVKVGFAVRTQDSPYYVALTEGLQTSCDKMGWDLTVLDANDDTTKEAENMDTLITSGMDLIFLDCVDPSACVPSINSAKDADIPVINVDSGVDDGAEDVTTVYSDNKQNGRLVGLAYAEYLEKEGRNAEEIIATLLSGNKGSVAGQERRTGLFCGIIESRTGMSEADAWKKAEAFESDITSKGSASNEEAKFSVRGQGWGNWSEAEGLDAAEDLITANKDLTCILGENDQMLFGAMNALTNNNIQNVDMVAAADGAKSAFDLIKKGEYFASGLNSPGLIAETATDIAKEILVDGKDPWSYDDITLTKAVAVTADNVEEYYEYGF